MPDSQPTDPRQELKEAWNGEWTCVMDSCSPHFPSYTFSMTVAVGNITKDLYKNPIDQVGIYFNHPELKESPWNCHVRDSSLVMGLTPLDYDDVLGWYEYEGVMTQYQGEGTIQFGILRFGTQLTYSGRIIKK